MSQTEQMTWGVSSPDALDQPRPDCLPTTSVGEAGDGIRSKRSHLRVLIVEDNEDHAILIQLALRARGHSVVLVRSSQQAESLLQSDAYDVMALDYQLPDATGLQLLDRLRTLRPTLPAVMVTASGSEQIAVSALKSGASDYVVKVPGYERELTRALELAAEEARARLSEATLRAELEKRATIDPLTGLLNRGELERLIREEIERTRCLKRPLSFALLDADGFKATNDRYGHPAGDALLCQVAAALRASIRAVDSVARWGGDEFALLLPGAAFGTARAITNRVRQLVASPPSSECAGAGDLPRISLSAGFVTATNSGIGIAELLKWADRALYAAKAGGRDRANFFVLGDDQGAMRSVGMPGRSAGAPRS